MGLGEVGQVIETISDEQDKIVAYCDWKLINQFLKLDNKGLTCWIDNFFCHNSIDIFYAIDVFTRKIITKAPWIKYVYFQRYYKYGNDSWKLYNAEKFLRRIKYGFDQDTGYASPNYCRSVSVAVC